VLRGFVEGSCGPDEGREEGLQLLGKRIVAIAVFDMVENVVQNVQDMKTPALSGRNPNPLGLNGCCGILVASKRFGEGEEILGEGGGPSRRGNQVAESPLLASLARGLADGSQHSGVKKTATRMKRVIKPGR
jgi:hypothetical protein